MKRLVRVFRGKKNIKKDELVIRTLGIGKEYLSSVFLSVTLDSELREEFIRENRDVEILNIGNEDVTIVSYELFNKWNTKQKEKNCNCREYEVEIHTRLMEESILDLARKLNIAILKKKMKYKDRYLYLKVRKNENIGIFEDVMERILSIPNGRDERWECIDDWIEKWIKESESR